MYPPDLESNIYQQECTRQRERRITNFNEGPIQTIDCKGMGSH